MTAFLQAKKGFEKGSDECQGQAIACNSLLPRSTFVSRVALNKKYCKTPMESILSEVDHCCLKA